MLSDRKFSLPATALKDNLTPVTTARRELAPEPNRVPQPLWRVGGSGCGRTVNIVLRHFEQANTQMRPRVLGSKIVVVGVVRSWHRLQEGAGLSLLSGWPFMRMTARLRRAPSQQERAEISARVNPATTPERCTSHRHPFELGL
jgi:hypothetical protein